jgi:hypothetical protein
MVHFVDNKGATPAFYAVLGAHLPCLKYLIEKARADVHATTHKGQSLMHAACLTGHMPTILWLLNRMDKRAIEWKTIDNATAFHFAACMSTNWRHREQTIIKLQMLVLLKFWLFCTNLVD